MEGGVELKYTHKCLKPFAPGSDRHGSDDNRWTLQTSPMGEPARKHWNTTSSTLNTDHLDLHNDTQDLTISQDSPPYKPVVQEKGRSKPSCL